MRRQPFSCEVPQDLERLPVERYDILSKGLCLDVQNQVISHATARPNLHGESVEKGTTPSYTETSPLVKIASRKQEKVD